MKASVGDHIELRATHAGEGRRKGEVIEVRQADGAPPYLVRWSDGPEGLFFPGADAVLVHPQTGARREPKAGRRAR